MLCAVSLLFSRRASQDIHKLNKVEESMNNLSALFSAPIFHEIFIATSVPGVQRSRKATSHSQTHQYLL